MSKLSVNLVTWNGAKYVPFLFESLRKQTYKDWTLFVLDNNSNDNTVELIKKELGTFPVQCKIIENKENRGFAGGHNQALENTDADLILIINQDLYLAPNCIEKLVAFLQTHQDAACVAPRTMRWNFAEQKFTNTVDSLGLRIFRNRRVIEIGEGEEYVEVEKDSAKVFGCSGAIALLRKTAITDVGGLFDESFKSYKEDVDLAFRINAAGWKSYVLYSTNVYHDRSGFGVKHKDDFSSALGKTKQSDLVRYHSYKNHLATLYKNEYWQNFTLDFPWILWYELKKFAYFLLFDRQVLSGLKELFGQDLAKKRRLVKSQRKISWQEMRKWWRL
jgi:GT2 family glycosyltransferase